MSKQSEEHSKAESAAYLLSAVITKMHNLEVLEAFEKNALAQNKDMKRDSLFYLYDSVSCREIAPEEMLDNAFVWAVSPEGEDFWKEIDSEIRSRIHKAKKILGDD